MTDTLLIAVEKCPLCESSRRKLTCIDCVQRGSFAHSSNPDSETYCDRRNRVIGLLEAKKSPENEIKSFDIKNSQYERKRVELIAIKSRIDSLKEIVGRLATETEIQKQELSRRRQAYEKSAGELKYLKIDLNERDNEIQKHSKEYQDKRKRLEEVNSRLVQMRRKSLTSLKNEIFPITLRPVYKEFGTPPGLTVATRGMSNDLIVETSQSAETDLEDATKYTYEEGKWIQTSFSETEYCVAGTGLPASGDYFKYFEWLKSYRKEPRGPEDEGSVHAIPVLEIPAALTHTCQALKVSSKILGISLPHKVNFGDFGNPYINQKKLCDAVTKLNKNIMYLCFTQLVPPNQLSPMQTLKNLDTCLSEQNKNLGQIGTHETFPYELPDIFLEQDPEILDETDFDSGDDEASVKDEWDSLKDLQELPSDLTFSDARSSPSEQSLSSSATGLVTSAAASMASLWPWKKN